jgi:hypothetical protein
LTFALGSALLTLPYPVASTGCWSIAAHLGSAMAEKGAATHR